MAALLWWIGRAGPVAALLVLLAAPDASACRIVDPRPIVIEPAPPERPAPRLRPIETRRHQAEITVDGQTASVAVEAVFHNPNGMELEGTYFFPLPADVAVERFSLFMNGTEVAAELLDADRARAVYEDIVRRRKDPGLLEYVGMQMIKLRVYPIPANGEVKIRLRYAHLVRRDSGLFRLSYPFLSAKPAGEGAAIDEAAIRVRLANRIAIANVYSPSHRIDVARPDDHHAVAGFEAKHIRPGADFELYWSTAEEAVGASVLARDGVGDGEEGHFLLMLSPRVELPDTATLAKDVVFVLDKSGSMQHGRKLAQAKDALAYCLRKLRPGDTFGLIAFSTGVRPFRSERVPATEANVAAAIRFLDELDAAGGTAIDEALGHGLKLLAGAEHVPMLLFLTDGLPTVGETDVERILGQATVRNEANARVFAFGVGYDVNAKLLDRLAEEGRGQRAYVKPEEDIEVKVSALYEKIASPVLSGITVDYGGVEVHDVYPKQPGDLFRGGQILLLGRFRTPQAEGPQTLTVRGAAAGRERSYTYPIHWSPGATATGADFLPGLWAMRKVGYLLDQIRLHGETEELVEEVKSLAKRHGLVTPYTSFLAVEDSELDGRAPRPAAAAGGASEERKELQRRIGKMEEEMAEGFRDAESGAAAQDASALSDAYKGGATRIGGQHRVRIEESAPATSGPGGSRAHQNLTPGRNGSGGGPHREPAAGPRIVRAPVRQVGEKTFVRRDGVWTDTAFDPAVTPAQVVAVTFLGEAYFKLLREHPELGAVLALGENVIVEVDGVVYKVTSGDP
ncbi:MAG: VIT and vWA domain-containing protein [Planctomycetota bacterium]